MADLKDLGLNVPSLLPLQAPPQNQEQVLNYLQSLHNYLAGDRLKIARAIDTIAYFRHIISPVASSEIQVAANSKVTRITDETRLMEYDSAAPTGEAAWNPIVAGNVLWAADASEPTGFLVPNGGVSGSASIGLEDSGTTFYIEPYDTEFSFYIKGEKFTKTAKETVDISSVVDISGNWYVYYNTSGELVVDDAVTFEDIIRDNCFVAEGYSDNSNVQFLMRETHGLMPWEVHLWAHINTGAFRRSGLGLENVTAGENGNDDEDAEFNAAAGVIMDEDITHTLASNATAGWKMLYYVNGEGWKYVDSTFPDAPVLHVSDVPQYNDMSGGGALANVDSNDFWLVHVFATNIAKDEDDDAQTGHVAVLGQGEYDNLSQARDAAPVEIGNLYTAGLPMPEYVAVATVIYQRKGSNQYESAVVEPENGVDYISWLNQELVPGQTPATHNLLTGRDAAGAHPADAIETDTTNFDGKLSGADADVQAALDTLDDHTHVEADITDLGSYADASHNHALDDLSDVDITGKGGGSLLRWNATTSKWVIISRIGVDSGAIHKATASEISAITEKASPVSTDMLIIEDSAASNAKKMVQIGNLPGSAPPAPQTLAATNATGTASSTSYTTCVDVSSGPYLIHLVKNTDGTDDGYFKITIDGTAVITDAYVTAGLVAVGAGAGSYAMTLSARSSFKVEAKILTSGAMDWQVTYQQVGIT